MRGLMNILMIANKRHGKTVEMGIIANRFYDDFNGKCNVIYFVSNLQTVSWWKDSFKRPEPTKENIIDFICHDWTKPTLIILDDIRTMLSEVTVRKHITNTLAESRHKNLQIIAGIQQISFFKSRLDIFEGQLFNEVWIGGNQKKPYSSVRWFCDILGIEEEDWNVLTTNEYKAGTKESNYRGEFFPVEL